MSSDNQKNFPLTDKKAAEILKEHPDAVVIKEKDADQEINASQEVEKHIEKEDREVKIKLRGS